jgi:cell division control protein 6
MFLQPSSLSASPQLSPKESPIKRSQSMPNPSTCPGIGIDTNSLHAYYSLVLSRTESKLFEPVSRSEFGDLLSILEGPGVGLISMSSAAGALKGFFVYDKFAQYTLPLYAFFASKTYR